MDSGSDMRIPVLFGAVDTEAAAPDRDAWLVEDGAAMPAEGYAARFALPEKKFGAADPGAAGPGHAIGCACCTLRGPAADALTRMFRARATGAAPYFKRVRVLASPAGEASVREALENDVVTVSRYVGSD